MSSTTQRKPKSNRLLAWFGVVCVLFITAVGTWLRVEIAIRDPLWLDELHTSWVVSGDLGNVAQRAVMGNQTPTCFWWVYAVVSTGGQSPFTLRFISIVAGSLILLVGGLYVLARTKSTAAALITTTLLAFDSNLLFYATEARPYALLQLVALLASLVVVGLICAQPKNDCDPNRKSLVRARAVAWIAILCAFALAIHPTAILFVPAIVGSLGIRWLMRSKLQIKGDVNAADSPGSPGRLTSGLGAVIFIVGLIVSLGVGLWFLISPTIEMAWSRRGLWSGSSDWQSLAFRGACLVLICGVVPWLLVMFANRWRSAGTNLEIQSGLFRASVGLVSIFIMTIACAILLDVSHIASLGTERYAALVWPLVSVCAGLVAGAIRRSVFRLVAIVALPNLIWFLSSAASIGVEFKTSRLLIATQARMRSGLRPDFQPQTFRHEDWEGAVDHLSQWHPVYLMSNIIEDDFLGNSTHYPNKPLLDYLAFPVSGIYQLSPGTMVYPKATHARNRMSNEDFQAIEESSGCCFIIRGNESTVNEILDDLNSGWREFASRKRVIQTKTRRFGDVWLIYVWIEAES